MKWLIFILPLLSFFFISILGFCEPSYQDSVLAKFYFKKGDAHYLKGELDSSNFYYQIAGETFYENGLFVKYLECMDYKAYNLIQMGEYYKSQEVLENALITGNLFLKGDEIIFAKLYNTLGTSYQKKGRFDMAKSQYYKAITIINNPNSPRNIPIYGNLSNLYLISGNYQKAIELLKICEKGLIKNSGNEAPPLSSVYSNLGEAYFEMEDFEAAMEYYTKSLQIRLKIFSSEHPEVARSYFGMSRIFINQHKPDEAIEYSKRALDIRIKQLGELHPDVAISYNMLALIYQSIEMDSLALSYLYKSLEIDTANAIVYRIVNRDYLDNKVKTDSINLPSVGSQTAHIYHSISLIHFKNKKYDLTKENLNKALKIYEGYSLLGNAYYALFFNDLIKVKLVESSENRIKCEELIEYTNKALNSFLSYDNIISNEKNPLDYMYEIFTKRDFSEIKINLFLMETLVITGEVYWQCWNR